MFAISRLKHNLTLQIIKNLIITKIAIGWQNKELVFITDAFETQNDNSLLYHIELWECIAILNNLISR